MSETQGAVATNKRVNIDQRALVELGACLQRQGYHFITVTPLTHARNRDRHRRAENLRDIFGWSLPFEKSLVSDAEFCLMERAGILEPYAESWRSTVRWSSLENMLVVHSAYPTDGADAVFLGPDTYRFARLIKHFLQGQPTIDRAIDVGTGSGAGAMLIAREYPRAQVLAGDINPQALTFCAVNAELAGASNIRPLECDLLADAEGRFDLVVANPPYMMDPLARSYRHGGDALGAELSWRILEQALTKLNPGGTLLLYTGVAIVDGRDRFYDRLADFLSDQPCRWHYEEVDPDVFSEELLTVAYAQVERIAVVCLRLTWKGG